MLERHKTTMTALVDQAFSDYRDKISGCCGEDQNFMAKYVWRKIRDRALNHDSHEMRCRRHYGAKTCRDFPLGPRNVKEHYFVGAPFKDEKRFTSNVTGHICTIDCRIG
jgi:hypothetical protein